MARDRARRIEDFAAVMMAVSRIARKEAVALVGGHAVNAWALVFEGRLRQELFPFAPLTSVDIDLHGNRSAALSLVRELGARLIPSGPREITDGRLVIGSESDSIEIDILRAVNGVPRIRPQDAYPLIICGCEIPVLAPHLLLKGKLANVLHIDQSGRQDGKHVEILLLVLREFLREVVVSAGAGSIRPALTLVADAVDVLNGPDARAYASTRAVSFRPFLPIDALEASAHPRMRRFRQEYLARHLAG